MAPSLASVPETDPAAEPLLAQDAALLVQDETPHLDAQIDEAFAPRRTGWEDPDDTLGLLDEDKAGERRATIFKPEHEAAHLEGATPSDPRIVLKQGLLCASLVGISVYESVFKSKAMRDEATKGTFDITSLYIMQSVVSIVVGLGLAGFNGELKNGGKALMAEPLNAMRDFFVLVAKFAPPGILFGAASYVSMIVLAYLSADVFKVLEQTRLMVMAILAYFILKRKLSISSWVALVSITLTCLAYGRFKTADMAARTIQAEIKTNVARSERLLMSVEVDVAGSVGPGLMEEATHLVDDLRKSHAAEASELLKSLKKLAAGGMSLNESKSPMVGFLLTALFVMMSCFAAVYSEIILKKEKHVPFYVQKIYLEISGGLFAVFTACCIRPLLLKNDIATKELAVSFTDPEFGLFAGWDYWTIPVLFLFILAKSWLSGIICKQLSAIAKQLCSIVAVVVLYFFILMHDCKLTDHPAAFMCPSNLSSASFNIIIIDLAVLCSVVSYTAALRDKKRKQMFKAQIGEAGGKAVS